MSLWRRLWASLPLSYKLVIYGLSAVMTATLAVSLVTYLSASESLKLQMERQLSRDLNVFEKWYTNRLEELQLSSIGLSHQEALSRAIAGDRLGPAAALLDDEGRRLQTDFIALIDAQGRFIGPKGPSGRVPAGGLIATALAHHEPRVGTEAWDARALATLPPGLKKAGLVRLVVTPLGSGALVFGDRIGTGARIPNELTTMIGGGIAIADLDQVITADGFPVSRLSFPQETWADLRGGRYFFSEQTLAGRDYLFAFRPLNDTQGHTVGAFVRGFPESEIGETLQRYAGEIFLLAASAVVISLLAFLWATRRLLFPLHRLVRVSASLAAGEDVELPAGGGNDELARIERGVATLADRLTQSREDLAESAIRLEAEAQRLSERNAQLAALNEENARLLSAIRDHDRQRGQLIEKIITAQEDERKRIARELHDQTGQSLTSLLVGLKYVEGAQSAEEMRVRTAELKRLTVMTLEEVHTLSLALRPAMLDDLGLLVAVRSFVKEFGAQHGLNVQFKADALEGRLPPLWEVTLYRVVQESLTNVAKYARAREATVRFALDGPVLTAEIADDGVGFDPHAIGQDGREHLGLLGMRERIALIDGEFTLDAAPGRGTRVCIRAVLPSTEKAVREEIQRS